MIKLVPKNHEKKNSRGGGFKGGKKRGPNVNKVSAHGTLIKSRWENRCISLTESPEKKSVKLTGQK